MSGAQAAFTNPVRGVSKTVAKFASSNTEKPVRRACSSELVGTTSFVSQFGGYFGYRIGPRNVCATIRNTFGPLATLVNVVAHGISKIHSGPRVKLLVLLPASLVLMLLSASNSHFIIKHLIRQTSATRALTMSGEYPTVSYVTAPSEQVARDLSR